MKKLTKSKAFLLSLAMLLPLSSGAAELPVSNTILTTAATFLAPEWIAMFKENTASTINNTEVSYGGTPQTIATNAHGAYTVKLVIKPNTTKPSWWIKKIAPTGKLKKTFSWYELLAKIGLIASGSGEYTIELFTYTPTPETTSIDLSQLLFEYLPKIAAAMKDDNGVANLEIDFDYAKFINIK